MGNRPGHAGYLEHTHRLAALTGLNAAFCRWALRLRRRLHGYALAPATTVRHCGVAVGRARRGVQGQLARFGRRLANPGMPRPSLRPAIARADAIIAAMHDALLWELNSGLQQGGATLAIQSCHMDSDRVAQRVGRRRGCRGRANQRPAAQSRQRAEVRAAPLVIANAGRRAKDVAGFAVDLGGKLGVLRPIAEEPRCAACHGPADKFVTAVRAELRMGIRSTAPSASTTATSGGGTWVGYRRG